jgi:MGT family glycosyltransferase
MKEEGHDVSFLLPGLRWRRTHIQILDTALAVPQMIQRHHIRVDLLRPALSVLWASLFLPWKTGYQEIVTAIDFLSRGVEFYARQISAFVARERPDVIVTDFAFLAASLAAEVARIPFAVIYHSGLPFRGELIPPFGSGLPIGADAVTVAPYLRQEKRVLQLLDDRINLVRRRLGLPSFVHDLLRTPNSPWLNLIASVASAEAPRDNLTTTTLFVGPCTGKRNDQPEFPFTSLKPEKFKIYVSLGTIFNNRPWFFQTIMRALDLPDYQVILSAGGAFARLQRDSIPSNTMIFRSVPQVALLSRVDLFISHGGNNSINEALAAGKPILVVPIGGEQGDNAARIVYLGVGKRLEIAHLDEEQLRSTVAEIRTDARFASRASEIRTTIQTTEGLATASRCIHWLARHRLPLCRSAHCPVTITRADWKQLLGAEE